MAEKEAFKAKPNTQITYGDLKLGLGAIEKEDGQEGAYFVFIWPFVQGEEKGRPSFRAAPGTQHEIAGYQIEVEEITEDTIDLTILEA